MCLAYQGFEFKSFCFEDLLLPNAECNCHKLQEKKPRTRCCFLWVNLVSTVLVRIG